MGLEGIKSGAFILRFLEVRGEAGGGGGGSMVEMRRAPRPRSSACRGLCRVVAERSWDARKVQIRSVAESAGGGGTASGGDRTADSECRCSLSRLLQLITSIVAFSTVVDYDISSRIKFVVRLLGTEQRTPAASPAWVLWWQPLHAPVAITHHPTPPQPADVHRHHRLRAGPVLHGAVCRRRSGGECQ